MKLLTSLLVVIFLTVTLAIGGTVKGIVKDSDTGDPLIGANVLLKGTGMGASSDLDGFFLLSDVPTGDYQLEVLYVGYEKYSSTINVNDTPVELTIVLKPMVYSGKEITVLADRATRETPVAYSTIEKKDMEVRLGSRDIPLVLNTTPSVYSTQQGGGPGDARVNVRGFNQRNVAIMINGVPVNDMENGWLYWSNWDGVADATSSIQLQRGLSAVNLATPSVGGTMNIITDPAAQNSGLNFKQEFGYGAFKKSTLSFNTGLINDKFAFNGTVVRKTATGIIDAAWTDAWAYYFGAAYNINKENRLELYAIGAPQRHGQNLYKQNIAVYDKNFAESLDSYDKAALGKYNEAGRTFNQNWAPISPTYTGKQWTGTRTENRYNSAMMMERENFYHKPQVNLNYYYVGEKIGFYSTLYYSGGFGGGTGTLGSLSRNPWVVGNKWYKSAPWVWDWNTTIANNQSNVDSTGAQLGSKGILRNSRNNQWTIGAITKGVYKLNKNLKAQVGVDWRTAEIEHYREVRDLLGGAYWVDKGNDAWGPNGAKRSLGDKIDYNFTNTVNWLGSYVQSEYTTKKYTGYLTVGWSMISYTHQNHFLHKNGAEVKLESDNFTGYQFKGGFSYRLNSQLATYANGGYIN
ncbi:MAG TPA: TonB-dependent receptor, partial [Caldithrix sp.]|nr:TonB-dependent receptor [Caldithrix sp.]